MYKLLALDIDDTLLNKKAELTNENKEAISRAVNAGIIVTISTGRAYIGAKKICEKIGLKDMPVITFGGANIVEYPSGKILYSDCLSNETAHELVDFANEISRHIQLYDGDIYIYQKECDESRFYESRLGYRGKEIDIMNSRIENSAKALMIIPPEDMEEVMRQAEQRFGGRLRMVRSFESMLEFYNIGIDKGTALKHLSEILGVERAEIVAMGDSGIDAPMLKYAGLGIAVENAMPEAKNAADLVTISADDNAVAHIIDTVILA